MPACAPSWGTKSCAAPVSYTHLDVYKRQLLIILAVALLIFGPKNLPKLGKMFGKTINGFKKGMEDEEGSDDSEEKTETVSYTHLDVYKRQIYWLITSSRPVQKGRVKHCSHMGHSLVSLPRQGMGATLPSMARRISPAV